MLSCNTYLSLNILFLLDFESSVLEDPSLYYTKLLEYSPNSTLGKLGRGAHLATTGRAHLATTGATEEGTNLLKEQFTTPMINQSRSTT